MKEHSDCVAKQITSKVANHFCYFWNMVRFGIELSHVIINYFIHSLVRWSATSVWLSTGEILDVWRGEKVISTLFSVHVWEMVISPVFCHSTLMEEGDETLLTERRGMDIIDWEEGRVNHSGLCFFTSQMWHMPFSWSWKHLQGIMVHKVCLNVPRIFILDCCWLKYESSFIYIIDEQKLYSNKANKVMI